jgi:hypothetical protein
VELGEFKKLGSFDSLVILESCNWSYNFDCEVSRRVVSKNSELCRVESVASRMHR